ncbi:MAG TPA: EAL domain-containing protein [Jatrophihabitans sp.]|nr:EAL domain-containing protein [Jatrophihabitans sp.]
MNLSQLLSGGSIRTVFQPIVNLDAGTISAYEALSRGPAGELERPDLLFAAARAAGVLAELDEQCRTTALRSAVAAGISAPLGVFVNVEPEVLDSAPLGQLIEIAETAPGGLQVVLEITERAIATRPAELLACVRQLRAAGWRIALDDVGADDMSLAFMPLLRPDIVKLDLKLVQERPGPAVAGIMNAVNAYAQRSGAILLAEGIEDEKHLEIARALGATLGQGWLFGRPAAGLNESLPAGALHLAPPALNAVQPPSPFQCLPADQPLRRSTKPLLIELSKQLEREALRYGSTCIVVSTFQQARHFTPATAERYRELAGKVAFVAAIGDGLSSEPVRGVRGAQLAAGDPLQTEWDIAVLAPHFSAALLARDLGDTGADSSRRFEFALTYERDTVAAAMQSLLSRVLPAQQPVAGAPAVGGEVVDESRVALPARGTLPAQPAGLTEMLQRALAATTNGVAIADVTRPDHPLIYVNTAFERLSGYRGEDILGSNCRFLQGPGTDRAAVARIAEAIRAGRQCRETLLNYRAGTGEEWWNEILLSPVFDDDGTLVQYIGVQNDVSARVRAESALEVERQRSAAYLDQLQVLAYQDSLTGLLNRRRLYELLPETVAAAAREESGIAFVCLDIDDFKQINDTLGHVQGDNALAALAERLRRYEGGGAFAARLGGDEFVLVLPGQPAAADRADVERLTRRFRSELRDSIDGLRIDVSVGVSMYPADGTDYDALLHIADMRMYAGKARAIPA